MHLDEIETEAQMKSALKKGDPELEHDIERAVREKIEAAWYSPTTELELGMEEEELTNMVEESLEDVSSIVDHFESSEQIETMLEAIPADTVKDALRDEVKAAAERSVAWARGVRRTGGDQIFEFTTGQGGGITLRPVYLELFVTVDEPLSWVPEDKMLELLDAEGPSGSQWEPRDDRDAYTSGWIDSGDYWRLEVDPWKGYEWAVDLRQDYFSGLVDAEPGEAIAAFMRVLAREDPALAKKVKKAKLPKELLADYAVVYFEDPEHGMEIIAEAMGSFGYKGSRGKVLLELDRAALQAIGITRGRWWDGAPWKLVDLPPEELAYEGTLMRHCVGRHDMGYREAVQRGMARIWSLRSRHNKPVLTFEVDAHEWDAAGPDARALRGGAIEQLKGKLNRLAGGDPDEARVLHWIFARMAVDPAFVQDFVGEPSRARTGNHGFNAPWRPYRDRGSSRLKAASPLPTRRIKGSPLPTRRLKRRLMAHR